MIPGKRTMTFVWVGGTFLLIVTVAAVSFLQGMFYANRRATIQMANDGCLYSLWGLTQLKEPQKQHLDSLLESNMDESAAKLAEMSLRYPSLIKRIHYNALVKVRDYRAKYGRPSGMATNQNPLDVDTQIAKAIAYLESIHDMNDWVPFKVVDDGKGGLKVRQER